MNKSNPTDRPGKARENESENTVIPVLQEKVTVGKKLVDKAKVRLSKKVHEHLESFEIPLTEEQIVVKRVAKNEIIDSIPDAMRYEGDIMIIPVLKEVAVIEKKMMLVEEIHVKRTKHDKMETRQVVVRTEEVTVERTELTQPDNQK